MRTTAGMSAREGGGVLRRLTSAFEAVRAGKVFRSGEFSALTSESVQHRRREYAAAPRHHHPSRVSTIDPGVSGQRALGNRSSALLYFAARAGCMFPNYTWSRPRAARHPSLAFVYRARQISQLPYVKLSPTCSR
jgi:hypothetical protein